MLYLGLVGLVSLKGVEVSLVGERPEEGFQAQVTDDDQQVAVYIMKGRHYPGNVMSN